MAMTQALRWRTAAVAAVTVALGACTPTQVREAADLTIDDSAVYPESLTSTQGGTLFVGSIKGNVYRALPAERLARAWIRPDARNGLGAVFGVLADEGTRTLWVCSTPNPFVPPVAGAVAALVAFDLERGTFRARYDFPAPRSVCNDMTVSRDGSVYATDTANGRILRLRKGAASLDVYGEGDALKGADGIAFDSAGRLYVNIVTRGALLRVEPGKDGRMGALTPLEVDATLGGPDGMRLVEGTRFLLAEGTAGRIDEVRIEGDRARVTVLKSGLKSSPGVTRVGRTAYAIEGKIGYLTDPALRGQDPGPFTVTAIPLP
jgi:sugar lactone lactonase YvrE